MGNSDKSTAQSMIKDQNTQNNTQTNAGIDYTQGRINTLAPRADAEEGSIWNGYSDLASGKSGIDPSAANRLLSGNYSSIPGGSGGGGGSSSGGGAPGGSGAPSYLDTFHQLQNPTGGFDADRLGNINSAAGQLQDTSGNYGTTDTSTSGLQKFAATGGLSADQLSSINQPTLTEFAKTGGYDDAAKANMRARANSGIASTYGNLQDSLARSKAVGNNIGPGWSSAGFKLARQGAQDQATTAQNTEAGIQDAVNQNRMSAAGKLGDLGLGTAQLQSGNTLSGYSSAGSLANQKQSQIDAAKEASAGINTNTQALINQSRLSAAGGESQDTIGKGSIAASSAAANAALNAANQRFLISEGDQNRATGLGGMLGTYQASPGQLMGDQAQLLGYRGLQGSQGQGLVNSQIATGHMPGITDGFKNIMGGIGSLAGIGSGIMGGFGGYGGGGGDNSIAGEGLNPDAGYLSSTQIGNGMMPGYPGGSSMNFPMNPTQSYGGTP